MIAEGADIIDIGAESTRPYGGAQPVSAETGTRAPAAGAGRYRRARRSRLDRQHESRRSSRWALEQAPRSPTTSGACSAIPTWPTLVAARNAPVIVMHNREQRRSRHRHHGGRRRRSSRARSRSRRKAGIPHGQYRARSRHRLRQDAGAEHDRAGAARRTARASACRSWSAPRASASSVRCVPSEPQQRLGGSIAAHLIAAQRRRADHPDP